MEPRFSLPPDTPLSSKTEIVIGGVRAYVYGLEELNCDVDDNIAISYLAPNRTRSYKVTEGVAHEVLHRYRTDGRRKKARLVAVTMRNHGDREVNIASTYSILSSWDVDQYSSLDFSSGKPNMG